MRPIYVTNILFLPLYRNYVLIGQKFSTFLVLVQTDIYGKNIYRNPAPKIKEGAHNWRKPI